MKPEHKKDKKKDKVRSAWISFAGRIVAQLVGAIATVALGVMVLHRYTAPEPASALQPVQPAVTVIVISPPSKPSAGAAENPAAAADSTVQQVEIARAIGTAVSSALQPH